MENHGGDRPLFAIAKSWKGLQGELGEGEAAALRLGSFTQACSLISPLFGCLGVAFKFAEKDYVAKSYASVINIPSCPAPKGFVIYEGLRSLDRGLHLWESSEHGALRTKPYCVVHDLSGAAKDYATLPAMVDQDIRNGTVRIGGSHTRNLLRVLRGVDMVRVLFEHILVTEGNSLKEPASKAYEQVFAPHHGWAIRKAIGAGMFMLPTKGQFLKKLHEEEDSAREHIHEFVNSAGPVVQYINDMYITKQIGTNW